MSTTTVTRPAESSPGPSSRRSLWVVVLVGIAVAVGFILGSLSGRNTSIHLYTYTGTVDGVCGPVTTGVPRCFALTPDPGTAHADGAVGVCRPGVRSEREASRHACCDRTADAIHGPCVCVQMYRRVATAQRAEDEPDGHRDTDEYDNPQRSTTRWTGRRLGRTRNGRGAHRTGS